MLSSLPLRKLRIIAFLAFGLTSALNATAQSDPPGFGGGSPDPPVVSSFSPSSGAEGTPVRIRGFVLTQLDVYFGSVKATVRTFNTDTAIVVNVPVGASTAPLTMKLIAGGLTVYTTPTAFTVLPPIVAPMVSGISPGSGPVGARIRIRGRSLGSTSGVRFGNIAATSFAVSGDSLVTAIVPAGAGGSSKISLTLSSGTLSTPMFFPVTPPYAVIRSLSNASVRVGDSVRIYGRYFTGFSAIRFNGAKALQTRLASDSELVAVVPSGSTSGPLSIQGSLNTVSAPIVVVAPPQILSFFPSNGPVGEKVRLRGRGLSAATQVLFGNAAAQNLYLSGDSLLTVVVPAGASTARIVVNASGSSYASQAFFVVVPRPFAEIQTFSPTSAARGSQITLSGRHFTGTRFLRFGGVDSYTFTVQSDSVVIAIVPANAQAGPISLISLYNTARSAVGLSLLAVPSAGRVGEETLASEPSLFPNPSVAEATLRMPGADMASTYEMAAYTVDGRLAFRSSVTGSQLQEGIRVGQGMTPGLYTLHVASGIGTHRLRWVIAQ